MCNTINKQIYYILSGNRLNNDQSHKIQRWCHSWHYCMKISLFYQVFFFFLPFPIPDTEYQSLKLYDKKKYVIMIHKWQKEHKPRIFRDTRQPKVLQIRSWKSQRARKWACMNENKYSIEDNKSGWNIASCSDGYPAYWP